MYGFGWWVVDVLIFLGVGWLREREVRYIILLDSVYYFNELYVKIEFEMVSIL